MRKVLSGILYVTVIAVTLAVVLVAVSNLASEEGSAKVATEGQLAIAAESTLSSATAARNAAAQALILERGRAANAVSEESVNRANGQMAALVSEFVRRAGLLNADLTGAEQTLVAEAVAEFATEMDQTVEALAMTEAGTIPRFDALPTDGYEQVVAALVQVRDDRVLNVLVEAEYAGQVADAVRFLVIVVIPVMAMILLRSVMRRRRERESLEVTLARQSDVINSKDEFVANLSHELRTPLTGVYGFALALDEGGLDDPETAKELTGLIVNDAAELSRMVDDLITAGQVETGNVTFDIEDIDVDTEIQAVLEPFQRSGANITFSESGDSAEVDRLRFRQIVRNLVSNAVRHGGPNIDVFAEYGGGNVSIFVMDDGEGIPEDRVSQLFERYQHEGNNPLLQGSVGLGLAIAKSLAVGMEGSLTYTRTNGLTYFVLRLPSHRVAKLNERVVDQSLGDESASESASEIAKLFAR
ncbi:MAG: sensor histidine kinase [Acidimicrobiia bacterium]